MTASGYLWDNAMLEGRRRLALLEHSLDASTFRRLEAIAVQPGWRCLDLGAGGGTVCDWLCKRVGPAGRVYAVDLDARFVRALDHANLEVREENIVDSALPAGTFDLVHTRWTLMHIAQREEVLRVLVGLLKPGGILFLEEPDAHSILTLGPPDWRDLVARMFEVISKHGSHPEWGREVPSLVTALGLRDIRAEAEYPYFHGGSELAEFWKRSCSRVRDGLAAAGVDVSPWDPGLAQLDDPTRLFVAPMTVAVIAVK
jgi:SAM-dependent methyltransferase